MSRKRQYKRTILLAWALCLLPSVVLALPDYYVDANATGNNDGSTWEHAFTTLSEPMLISLGGEELWVADGTYAAGALPWESLQLRPGMRVYGGFQGESSPGAHDGETLLSERDPNPTTNGSIIDGDLGNNNRSSVLIVSAPVAPSDLTRCDGFTLTGASQHAVSVTNGSRAQFVNLRIEGNVVNGSGAGMFIDGKAQPVITDCDFVGNIAGGSGGAVYVTGNDPDILTRPAFEGTWKAGQALICHTSGTSAGAATGRARRTCSSASEP